MKKALEYYQIEYANISGAEAIGLRAALGVVIYKIGFSYFFCNREMTSAEFNELLFDPKNPADYLLG